MEGSVVVCGLKDGGAGVCLCLFFFKKCYAMGTLFYLTVAFARYDRLLCECQRRNVRPAHARAPGASR